MPQSDVGQAISASMASGICWVLLALAIMTIAAMRRRHIRVLRNQRKKMNDMTNEVALGHARFQRLALASARLGKLMEPDKVIKTAVTCSVKELEFRTAFVTVAQEDLSVKVLMAKGFREDLFRNLRLTWDDLEVGRDPVGNCLRTQMVEHVNLDEEKSGDISYRDLLLEHGFKSIAAVPIVLSDMGHGALAVCSDRSDAFTESHIRLLQVFGAHVTMAYEAAALYIKLWQEEQ